jgi:hypothetical protein
MQKNVGSVDRILRIVVGVVLIALVFVMPDLANPWGWIGVVPLVTALVGWCPAYTILGIKTCSVPTDKA